MADAMNFGPEWLRNLSSEGTTTGAPKYQLAEHRYGREEMLALFDKTAKPPESLTRMQGIFVEKIQVPAAIINMTEDEIRLWNRGINSDAVLRLNGKVPAGPPGMMRGRGTSVDRGRGRGRGTPGGFYYNRGNYDEGEEGGPMERPYLRQSRSFDRTQMGERNWPERNGAEPTDWNGSTSPRKEYGGVMRGGLDTWRRNRDDDDGWRQREKWTRPSWREEGGDGNGGRSQNWGRGWAEEGHHGRRSGLDEVPEWATVDSHEPSGSFDASGAFHGYSSDEVEGQSDGPSIRRIESARTKLFSDGSGEPRKTVSSNGGLESGRRKNPESEAPSGLTRSKTAAELGPVSPQPPPNTISKSASSAALSESQVLDRIRTQHQNFVTKPTEPESGSVKNIEKPSSNKHASQQPSLDQPPRVSPSLTQHPPPKVHTEAPPVQPHQVATRKRDSEGQGVPRQGSEDDMSRLSKSVVRIIEDEEPHKTLQQPPLQQPLPSLQQSSPSLQPPPSESDMWLYRDPQGNEQGPFRSSDMLSWYSGGYFLSNLLVRRVGDERYYALGELIARNGGVVPFSTAPTPSMPASPATDGFNPYLMMGQQQLQHQQQQQQLLRHLKLSDIDAELWQSLTQTQKDALLAQKLMQTPAPTANAPNPYSQAMNSTIAHFMHQFQQALNGFHNLIPQSSQLPQDAADPVRALLMGQPAPPAPHHLPIPVMPHIPPPSVPHQLHNSVLSATPATDLKKDDLMKSALSKLQSASKADQQQPSQRSPVDSLWSGPGRPMTWTNGLTGPTNSPLWNVKTEAEILAAEQQKQLQQRAEEERQKEEIKKMEELRKKVEEDERKEREAAEERRRVEEEEKKRAEMEESLRVLLGLAPRAPYEDVRQETDPTFSQREKEEKERKKMEDAKKKEDKRRKEELKKLEEASKKKEEEKERLRQVEEERRRQEEERLRLEREEEEERRREEELAQQQEQQRRQEEALRCLKEQQQRSRMKPWTQSPLTAASLAEIQAQEKEKKWIQQQKEQSLQEMLAVQAAAMEIQARENELLNSRSNGFNLKWAEQPPPRRENIKSLAEIQAEEQKRLVKQHEKEREERALQQRDIPANAGIWGSAGAISWANHNNSSPWGGVTAPPAVTPGFWDDAAPAAKAKAPQSPTKVKSQVNAVSAAKKQAKSNAKAKPLAKRDEAAVLELFKPQGDEFTSWCIATLHSMQTSIDVPTFAAFLRDVDNPFEVKDYIKQYLGETSDAAQFANQFLERRSRWKSAQKSSIEEDDMCAPAAAINPTSAMTEAAENAKKGKKSKKGKMMKVDSRILGFNVTAAQNRINVGQRETWDPNS